MAFLPRSAPDAVITLLKGAEFLQGARVLAKTSSEVTVGDFPVVTVVSAGRPSRELATTTENVLINVHSRWGPVARDYAEWIEAYLIDPGLVTGFVITPGANPALVPDAPSGGFIAAVTVRLASTKIGVNLT